MANGIFDAIDESSLTVLAGKAVSALTAFFDDDEVTGKDLAKAKMASNVLASYTRLRQAEGSRQALLFMVAREVAGNRDELRSLVTEGMPSLPLARLLPQLTKDQDNKK